MINLSLWWDFTVFPTTVTDSSLALWMTPYQFSPPRVQILHIRFGWRLTFPLLWRLTLPSLWRLFSNRHSERGQACLVGKTGNGTMNRSEESITLMTSYRLPHYGSRSFTFVQDDVLWSSSSRQRAFVISGWHLTVRRQKKLWRTQRGWGYLIAMMTQIVKEYLACSWQLTADSFYLLNAFHSTVTDPSHPLRMTFYRPLSLRTGGQKKNLHSILLRRSPKPVSSVRLRRPPPYK